MSAKTKLYSLTASGENLAECDLSGRLLNKPFSLSLNEPGPNIAVVAYLNSGELLGWRGRGDSLEVILPGSQYVTGWSYLYEYGATRGLGPGEIIRWYTVHESEVGNSWDYPHVESGRAFGFATEALLPNNWYWDHHSSIVDVITHSGVAGKPNAFVVRSVHGGNSPGLIAYGTGCAALQLHVGKTPIGSGIVKAWSEFRGNSGGVQTCALPFQSEDERLSILLGYSDGSIKIIEECSDNSYPLCASLKLHDGVLTGVALIDCPGEPISILSWSDDGSLKVTNLAPPQQTVVLKRDGQSICGCFPLKTQGGLLKAITFDDTFEIKSYVAGAMMESEYIGRHDGRINGLSSINVGEADIIFSWSDDGSLRRWSGHIEDKQILAQHDEPIRGFLAL